MGSGDEVGQPFEGGGIGISHLRWRGLFARQHVQNVVAILAVEIIDLSDPMKFLVDLLLLTQIYVLVIFWRLGKNQIIGAMYLG